VVGRPDGTWRILDYDHGSTGARHYPAAQALDDLGPFTGARIILVCRIRW
jgi:hypothetical protein